MPDSSKTKPPKLVPDQGWSWVILVAAFLCNVTFDGIIFSFGIFFIEMLDHFGASHGTTAWIGVTTSSVYALVGPLASILANKYGCRVVTIAGSLLASLGFFLSTFSPNIWVMYLTYGVMGGVGFGLMYLCAYVMIGHYFCKYRALATGITSCGSGVGTFLFAPLSVTLINHFGWKGAMWILSGIVLNGAVAGCLFRPIPQEDAELESTGTKTDSERQSENERKNGGKKKLLDLSLLTNASFMVFCLSSFLCMIGFFVPFIYLPDYAQLMGIPLEKGSFLLSVIGISNTVARVLFGYLSDKPWVDALKIYNTGLILGGAVTVSCVWLPSYTLLVVYAAMFGTCVAAYVSLCAIILVEFLGLEKLSDSFGFLNMFRGIATLIGAPLAGFLYDVTGSYGAAFYVAGAAIAAAGVICLPLRVFRRCCTASTFQMQDVLNKETTIIWRNEELNRPVETFESTEEIPELRSKVHVHAQDQLGDQKALNHRPCTLERLPKYATEKQSDMEASEKLLSENNITTV